MVDTLTKAERSARMARIRSTNTKPELVVRQIVRSLGYSYRLHKKDLPGRPDIVFPRLRKVIFVHGCFWHGHRLKRCTLARMPKSKLDFWIPKLENNRRRDKMNQIALSRSGWERLVVWECELLRGERVSAKIDLFLRKGG